GVRFQRRPSHPRARGVVGRPRSGPDSLRGYLERNCIALLSNHDREPIDPPSPGWLGRHARAPQIRSSGLWNVNHITEHYDPLVLDELADAVAATVRTPAT
ncbi:MAG TPA: hypothetical protein VFZ70_18570, partial [Euzebyales bacterium]